MNQGPPPTSNVLYLPLRTRSTTGTDNPSSKDMLVSPTDKEDKDKEVTNMGTTSTASSPTRATITSKMTTNVVAVITLAVYAWEPHVNVCSVVVRS